MRLPCSTAVWIALLIGCHSEEQAKSASTSTRTPPPCPAGIGNTITVHEALASRSTRAFVSVEGYLVLVSTGCTLMNCPEAHPNCNDCLLSVRLASSRDHSARTDVKTLPLYGSRVNYGCSSKTLERCVLDANGQHVIARGVLRYFTPSVLAESVEPVSLNDPEICQLSR